MRYLKIPLLLVTIIFIFSCKQEKKDNSLPPSTVYYGGDIITMVGDSAQYAEAVVVKDGKIEFVGDKSVAMGLANGTKDKEINLNGKTMVPGFIDGHAHFASFSIQAVGANILPSPDGQVDNIPKLIEVLKKWMENKENFKLTKKRWVFGMGFDNSMFEGELFPTKVDLDKVSKEYPIMIIHISGHLSVLNSKALELLGIKKGVKPPEGGVIQIGEDGEPNGILEEAAAHQYFGELSPSSAEVADKSFAESQNMALSYGYTTAHEGRALIEQHKLLENMDKAGKLKLDVVSYISHNPSDTIHHGSSVYQIMKNQCSKTYKNNSRYRVAGMKITLDGSPQGRTAWRTIPYLKPPENKDSTYLGFPTIPDINQVKSLYEKAFKNNWQIITHVNGDAAIDQMIKAIRPITDKYGNKDRRNVLIHGQYIREDQLDSLKKLDIIASLFPLHTFYWGDWHREIIGDSLANKISPTRTALNKGLRITIHTDAPVALPNLMRMVGISVERKSRSGKVIGANEKMTPYEALKAITIWSAYQHFEEKTKGTLEKGKLADMVILNKNPLKVSEEQIKEISVLETIKEGISVYSLPSL